MNKKIPLTACLAAMLALPLSPAVAGGSSSPGYDTLADGLRFPLSLAIGKDDSVLFTHTAFGDPAGPPVGKLSRVDDDGNVSDVYARPGWDVAGVQTRGSKAFFLESIGAGPQDERELEGYLKSINDDGEVTTVANLAVVETRDNPDGGQEYGFGDDIPDECLAQFPQDVGSPLRYTGMVDSHPYAIEVKEGTAYVADAGMNAILKVNTSTGETSVLAVLPPRRAAVPESATRPVAEGGLGLPDCAVGYKFAFEFVPTDVELGPDGSLYVSSLPGGPEDDSWGARGAIYKVDPRSGEAHRWADDLLSPTGIAVSDDGDVYVASMFGNEIVKVDARTHDQSRFLDVDGPAAVELECGDLFATTGFSFEEATGNVLEADIR